MTTPVAAGAAGHQTATPAHSIRLQGEPVSRSPRRPMASPVQVKESLRSASDTSNSPRSPPPPPISSSHSYVAAPASAAPAPADRVTTSGLRSPNPAKRVPNNPADELRSAVNRDVLREEARKKTANHQPGVQRNISAPVPATAVQISPPVSPTMISTAGVSTSTRADPRSIMPRNPSIDSTVSTTSTTSASRINGTSAYRTSPESAGSQDVASLIVETGSPEAAIQKLLNDKNQAASHNAQLWRLVEKQRSMILGLNKDLEKALKEKERYRKKLKDHLAQSESASALATANQQLEEMVKREDSPSPVAMESSVPVATLLKTRDISIESRKVSDTSDINSFGAGRSDTTPDVSNAPSSILPATPQSAGSGVQILRDIELVEAASASAHENRAGGGSPMKSPRLQEVAAQTHKKSSSLSSVTSNSQTAGSFSNPKSQVSRKAPPAPLKLSAQKEAEATARVTNNIIDPSDSEYDDDQDSGGGERSARGRRKTREEDDHERDVVAREEFEHRSQSKKEKKSKSKHSVDEQEPSSVPASQPDATRAAELAHAPTFQQTTHQQDSDAAASLRQPPELSSRLPKSNTAPLLLSPGLPMSPRPGDRPMNSPMPRAPNKVLNSIPMSPKTGVAGLPLSPRAPRQPIPLPPQTPLSLASPHLARAEAYQAAQTQHSALAKETRSSPNGTPERDTPSRSMDGVPMTPGEIYQGLATDQFPELLLPPNALPSIYVKTASSRMKPSRQSYVASKSTDENPVFTLAVHQRSGNKQLWRVEKTFFALAGLDEQIKATCGFRERLPDRQLFHGHAPAKIDARRSAIDSYFYRMLESLTDDKSGLVFCKFLSTDAISAERGEYFNISVDIRSDTPMSKRPRREGYLTKRGKNFGGWKARYFVLDGPVFKYFDAEGGAQLGSIKLQNAQIGKQSNNSQSPQEDEDNQFRHAFLVLEPKKKDSSSLVRHVLCAESDEERDLWVDALLQYVDYREDLEEVGGKTLLGATKPDLGPRSPRLQKSLNDLRPPSSRDQNDSNSESLRAVGYSDTVAGEAPIMGPPSPNKVETPSSPHDGNFGPAIVPSGGPAAELPASNHPNISAPINLQVISNAGDWGMKPPPTPQSKDKKRSIFSGFRGRSSSDLGPGDKVISSPGLPLPDQHVPGGFRAVFGAPLAEAVDSARPVDVATELPAVVYRCIEYLLAKNALAEEGIFRLSGSNTIIKGLKDRFNSEGDVNLLADGKYYDIHAVASLLKLYLRELPSSILTRDLHLEFLHCSEKHSKEKVIALNTLVHKLPRPNRALLDALSSLLLSIVNNSEVNKMNIRNVGIVFAPTLNVPAPLISSFVEDQQVIFGPLLDPSGASISTQQIAAAPAASTDLRSPRKQMFSDLPTPAYNQTTFQTLGVLHNDDTGMIPIQPSYAPYQVAPQGEGGFGSLNDALKSPTLYNTVANGVPSSRETKAKRRESALLGFGMGSGVQKKTSMTQLREQLREDEQF